LVFAELLSSQAEEERVLLEAALAKVNAAGKAGILRRLSGVCLNLGDMDAARRYFRELGSESGARVKIAHEFAQELERRGQIGRAEEELVWLSEQKGLSGREQAELYRELGRLELAQGKASEAVLALGQAEHLARSDRGLWLEILRLDFEASRQAGALREFAEGGVKTGRAEALLLAARAFEELGDIARAEEILRTLRERSPNDRQVRLAYALFLEQSGRVAEAASEYALVLELDPRDQVLANRVMELWVGLGEVGKAKATLERLAKAASSPSEMRFVLDACDRVLPASSCERFETRFESSQSAELLYELGERKFDRQMSHEALAIWKRASLLGQDSSAQLRYAEVLLNHEQFELAFGAYIQLGELTNLEILRARALGLERIAGQAEAELSRRASGASEKTFRRLLSLGQRTAERAEAARHLVQLWQRADKLDEEVRAWEVRARQNANDTEAWLVLSEAYAFKGEHELLREALLALKKASPGDGWAELRLLRAERGAGVDGAPPAGRGSSPVEYSLELSAFLRRSGQFQKAADVLAEALQHAKGSVELHLELGQVLRLLGDNRGALAHLGFVHAAEPERRDVTLALAEIELELSEPVAARSYFLRVLRANPRSDEVSRAAIGLGRAIEATSDSSSAVWAAELESELLSLFRAHPEDASFAEPLLGFYEWTLGDSPENLLTRLGVNSIQRGRFVDHSLSPLSVMLAKGKGSSAMRAVRLLARGGAELGAPLLLNYALKAGPPFERAEAMLALERTSHVPTWTRLAVLLREPEVLPAEVAWCGLYVLIGAKSANAVPLPLQLLESSRPELRSLAYLGVARRGGLVPRGLKPDAGRFERVAFALAEAFSSDKQAPTRLLAAAVASAEGQAGPFLLGLALASRRAGSNFLELPGALELTSRELLGGDASENLALRALDPRSLAGIEKAFQGWGGTELEPRADLSRELEKSLLGSAPSLLEAPVFESLLGAYAAELNRHLSAGGAAARAGLALLYSNATDPRRPPTPELRQAVWRLVRANHYRIMSSEISSWAEALRSLPSEELHAPDYQRLLRRELERPSPWPSNSGTQATPRELIVARLLAEKSAPTGLLAAAISGESNPLVRKRLSALARPTQPNQAGLGGAGTPSGS